MSEPGRFVKGEHVYLTVGCEDGYRDATVVEDDGKPEVLVVMRASRQRGTYRKVARGAVRPDRRAT